jgi:hypothetical protein
MPEMYASELAHALISREDVARQMFSLPKKLAGKFLIGRLMRNQVAFVRVGCVKSRLGIAAMYKTVSRVASGRRAAS